MATAGAEIQVENGNYSRIHNAIIEAIYSSNFSARELKCLLFLLRKTYGYSKKSDAISYEQFAEATGIARRHVMDTMQGLARKGVVIVESTGPNRPQSWTFNKYIEQWQLVTESVTSKVTKTSDQNSHQIDELVTKTVTTLVTESVTTTSDQNSHPQKKERKKRNISSAPADDDGKEPTEQQQWFDALCKTCRLDYHVMTEKERGKVAQAIRILRNAGYTLDHLRKFYHWWWNEFWLGKKGQAPTLEDVRKYIGQFKVEGLDGVPVSNGTGGMMAPVFNGSEK